MAISICCTASSLVGCSSTEQTRAADEKPAVAEMGSVNLALTGASSSGAVYRLRNALFQITSLYGDYETFVNSEDDPESTFLYLELPQGDYYVYLLPGYTVEQINGGSGGGSGGMTTSPIPSSSVVTTTGTAPAPTTSVGGTADEAAPAFRGWRGGVGAKRQSSYEQPEIAAFEAGLPDPDTTDETDTTDTDTGTDTSDIDTTDETTVEVDGGVTTVPPPDDAGGGGGETEAQLISENPAYVYVQAYQVSQVRFSFLVDGDTVQTDPKGALIIGADFYEQGDIGGTCEGYDPYEPNDFYSPTYVDTTYPLYAYMCSYDGDMYLFDAPVPEGELFAMEVTFDSSLIDIDIEYGTSDYYYLGGSYGVDDTETLLAVSNGGSYLLYAFSYYGGPAPYTVTFKTDFESLNSCCETSEEPFCNDGSVMACVCAIDGNCCTGSFDELCVQEAIAECGAQCELPEPTSTCCEAAAEPGCLDETVETCVCDIDPTCCTTGFDQNCANLAQGQCGAVCGEAGQ